MQWFDLYIKGRNRFNKRNKAALMHLKNYAGEKPLPFSTLTAKSNRRYAAHNSYLNTKIVKFYFIIIDSGLLSIYEGWKDARLSGNYP